MWPRAGSYTHGLLFSEIVYVYVYVYVFVCLSTFMWVKLKVACIEMKAIESLYLTYRQINFGQYAIWWVFPKGLYAGISTAEKQHSWPPRLLGITNSFEWKGMCPFIWKQINKRLWLKILHKGHACHKQKLRPSVPKVRVCGQIIRFFCALVMVCSRSISVAVHSNVIIYLENISWITSIN